MFKATSLWISVVLHGLAGVACLSLVLVTQVDYEEPAGDAAGFDVHTPEPPPVLPEIPSRGISLDPPAVEPIGPEENVIPEIVIREPDLPRSVKPSTPVEPLEISKVTSDLKTAADSEPRVSQNPKPDYPILARRKGWEGRVVLRVEVSAEGKPIGASVVESSGRSILDDAALEAVKGWKFEPALKNGRSSAGALDVTFEFRLE
jgi:protein TonB